MRTGLLSFLLYEVELFSEGFVMGSSALHIPIQVFCKTLE